MKLLDKMPKYIHNLEGKHNMKLTQKTVLVTGSSRGIGKAIALRFADAGYNIVINSSNSNEDLETTKEEIISKGCHCLSFSGNIGNYDFVRTMINEINDSLGGVDILINNAGISYVGLLTDMDISDWNNIVTTNLTSVFNCCQNVIPYMVHKKAGKILNISSVWGCVGASCEVAYSATKGGINSFTKALAKELAPSNIQVNAIACGAIDTSMNHFLDKEELTSLIDEIPSQRLGQTKEVADFAYEICHNNYYLTGQVIRLDGGWI